MAEIRLIDGNELRGIESLLNTDIIQASKEASWLMSQVLHDIDAMPTIDPETLPIVRELRAELERVTAERDAAVKDLNMVRDCSTCALQYTDKCLLEVCMDPCCSFESGDVPYKWRGPQKEAHP